MKRVSAVTVLPVLLTLFTFACGGSGGSGEGKTPPPPDKKFTLTVQKSGDGSGVVTSSPAGINCGASCSASFSSGTQVTLTAQQDTSSEFAGWSGACSGTGSCTVSMTRDRTVTATFNKKTVSEPTLLCSRETDFFERGAGLRAVDLTATGGIVGGGFKTTGAETTAVAVRYNESCGEEWISEGHPHPSNFNAAMKHPDEDVHFLAGVAGEWPDFQNAFLLKLNSAGQSLFTDKCQVVANEGVVVRAGAVFNNQLYLALTGEGVPRIVNADLAGKIDCQSGLAVRNSGDRVTDLWVTENFIWTVGDFNGNLGEGFRDAYLRKFDRSGNLVGSESAFADINTPRIAVRTEQTEAGPQTFVYLAGTKNEPTTAFFIVVKLDENGNEIWRRIWDGDNSREEQANSLYDIVLGNDCVAAVGGLTELQTADFNETDVGAICYTPDGEVLWSLRHGGLANNENAFTGVFDSKGNLFFVGNLSDTSRALVLKFRVPKAAE